MKVSTRGRYGLKVMFDLALNFGSPCISLKEISERQHISMSYLEQLMILLRRAGLVTSVRGAQGGYMLSRAPDQISVGEILTALEGTLAPTDCSEADFSFSEGECIPRLVYSKIYEGILGVVNHLTLQDMKREYYADYIVKEIVTSVGNNTLEGR